MGNKNLLEESLKRFNSILRYNYYLNESEEPKKKKIFIPRKLSDDDSRYSEWNDKQPIIDGKRINQYDDQGNKRGYWKFNDFDIIRGVVPVDGNYVNDKKEGIWNEYYDNGELMTKGNYTNDKKDGVWEFYFLGVLIYNITFKDDEEIKRHYFDTIQ